MFISPEWRLVASSIIALNNCGGLDFQKSGLKAAPFSYHIADF